MSDPLDHSAPFDDDQGTRISRKPTGAGSEPTEGTEGKPETSSQEHESGFVGTGGKPEEPSDIPTSRR